MFRYIRILVLCAIAGFLLATLFAIPEEATAGAVKGLFVGILIVWGEWKSKREKTDEVKEMTGVEMKRVSAL